MLASAERPLASKVPLRRTAVTRSSKALANVAKGIRNAHIRHPDFTSLFPLPPNRAEGAWDFGFENGRRRAVVAAGKTVMGDEFWVMGCGTASFKGAMRPVAAGKTVMGDEFWVMGCGTASFKGAMRPVAAGGSRPTADSHRPLRIRQAGGLRKSLLREWPSAAGRPGNMPESSHCEAEGRGSPIGKG